MHGEPGAMGRSAGGLVFTIEANRFLHHMVRFLVGTMLDIGSGRRPLADIDALLVTVDNHEVSPPVAPHGLVLGGRRLPGGAVPDHMITARLIRLLLATLVVGCSREPTLSSAQAQAKTVPQTHRQLKPANGDHVGGRGGFAGRGDRANDDGAADPSRRIRPLLRRSRSHAGHARPWHRASSFGRTA